MPQLHAPQLFLAPIQYHASYLSYVTGPAWTGNAVNGVKNYKVQGCKFSILLGHHTFIFQGLHVIWGLLFFLVGMGDMILEYRPDNNLGQEWAEKHTNALRVLEDPIKISTLTCLIASSDLIYVCLMWTICKVLYLAVLVTWTDRHSGIST